MRKAMRLHPVVRDVRGEVRKDICMTVEQGEAYRFTLHHHGDEEVRLGEAVVAVLEYPADTPFFGEGYNMLSMYGGTLANPRLTGACHDRDHYRMPQTPGAFLVYNLLELQTPEGYDVYGFSTCERFRGEFRLYPDRVEICQALEGVRLAPGGTLELEELTVADGGSLSEAYRPLRAAIEKRYPMRVSPVEPMGWCSWYCYGLDIDKDILARTMTDIRQKAPELKIVQIDDGYEKHMGDWLDESDKLGAPASALCRDMADGGFIPGIWAAPFTAEKDSRLFREHPDWFIQDEDGGPLSADKVTYPGWRAGPWVMLDGSHPGARQYLHDVFTVMRRDWGCRYFKLDANTWGALPFGKHYLEDCTSIQAYRMGMAAILDAIGEDSFVLGCNAPLWATLGLVNGMRVSTDIDRNWPIVRQVAHECLYRQYQHGSFWINDPDCCVVQGEALTEEEKRFHLAYQMAVGGVKMVSDRIGDWSLEESYQTQLFLATQVKDLAFLEADRSVAVGMTGDGEEIAFFFNSTDQPVERRLEQPGNSRWTEIWTNEEAQANGCLPVQLPPHAARVYIRQK